MQWCIIFSRIGSSALTNVDTTTIKVKYTLNRVPIEENLEDLLEDLLVSSGTGGKSPCTKEHLEAAKRS